MTPYIWMDSLGTWFSHKAYLKLDPSLQKGMFPLYKLKAMKEKIK